MKVVVDTNVITYLLLNTTDFSDETTGFWNHIDKVLAPAIWEAEITNVIWLAARERIPLVTYDQCLLRSFSQFSRRPRELAA